MPAAPTRDEVRKMDLPIHSAATTQFASKVASQDASNSVRQSRQWGGRTQETNNIQARVSAAQPNNEARKMQCPIHSNETAQLASRAAYQEVGHSFQQSCKSRLYFPPLPTFTDSGTFSESETPAIRKRSCYDHPHQQKRHCSLTTESTRCHPSYFYPNSTQLSNFSLSEPNESPVSHKFPKCETDGAESDSYYSIGTDGPGAKNVEPETLKKPPDLEASTLPATMQHALRKQQTAPPSLNCPIPGTDGDSEDAPFPYVAGDLERKHPISNSRLRTSDVLFFPPRASPNVQHEGTLRYCALCLTYKELYAKCDSVQKSEMVTNFLRYVRMQGGRFLEMDGPYKQIWYEIGDERATAKTLLGLS